MKTKSLRIRHALFLSAFFFGIVGEPLAQTLTDNASNSAYTSGWNNGSNGGTGFSTWSLSSDGANAGRFIGNPSDASYGMSSTNIGSTAFGLFGHSNQYSYALRNLNSSMGIGDILSFHWSMNWDCGTSGSKGWELKSGNTNIFGVVNSNSSTITYNGVASGTVSSNYGNSAMLVTVQRINASQYSISISRRNTLDGTFSTTITSSAAIDNIRIFIGGQQTNDGQRNIFFNNFQIQKPDQYRSAASGNWSSAGTWEISTDGGTMWSAAGSAPGSVLYSTITIRNGHTVSQNQNYSAGSNNVIVVESGATLNMTGASGDFKFNTMSVSGSVVRNHASNDYVGSITVNNGGKYVHALNGSTVQSVTWNSGSTLELTGVTNMIPTATGTYQNVIWNCPDQNAVDTWSALETNFNTVNGNFTVQNTGVGSLIIGNTATNRTMTVGGDFIISGGAFAIKGAGNSLGDIKLVVNGDFNQSSGIFRPSRRVSTSTGTAILELKGNFTLSGGTFENTDAAGLGSVIFAKTGTQSYTRSGGIIASAINFTVNSGSTLSMGTNVLDGSTGTFTLSSGGGLETGNTAGITTSGATGSVQVSGTRTYNTGANYNFNGSAAQVTGNGFTGANNLTINNSAGVTLSGNASLAGTLTLANGVFTVGSGNTITVANNGTISRTSGSLSAGTGAGTFTFSGTGTVSGTVGFNNVNIAGGVNFGTAATINGTLTINSGGFVNTNPPIYASGSTLKYNSGGTYGRGTEWSTMSSLGYPHNVQISNGTTLDLGANNGTATARQIAGNLTVDASSTLSMSVNPMTAALTVKGNYLNNGTTVLSSSVGGDLILEGNLNDNATFTANGRAVFFQGSNNQYINSTDNPLDIDVVRVNKSGGEVILDQNLLVDETADPIQFAGTSSILNLNGKTATFGKANTTSQITMNSTSAIKGSSASSLTILGTGSFGTVRFDQTNPGTTNVLQNLNIDRSTGSVILGENLIVSGNLTVTSGTITLAASKQLTVSGTLTNNGTLTLENGATFKQGSSIAGGGTYNVKQTLTDNAGSGSTLSGRYWYMGTPVSCTRAVGFGSASALNKVWSFTNGAYAAVADATTLSPTTGYVHRRSDNTTLTFSGTNLYASDVTLSLSNNAGTYGGWHLIANPYTAYLDWHQVYNASYALSTAISPSYYIRSFATGNLDALICYNQTSGLVTNTSSLTTLSNAQAQYIAPMQAVWVKINPTSPLSSTAGQLRLQRSYTDHSSGNVGLKNSTVFPTLARVNLVDGARFDQLLVFMNQDMSNAVDQYDSEKMFVSGAPQIYTMAAGKKLVMNGLKNNKKKISVPLYLELPESKVYNLQLAEYILEDGLILLEDKQEGIIQDFTIHDVYPFYANSGVLSNRFVLHFFAPDNGITAQGPSNSWVENETSYTEGGQIVISADGKGKVQITLDQPDSENNQATVQAVDANGREVYSGFLEGITTEIHLDVPSGVYYLTVQSGTLIEKKKVFIQE